MDLEFSVEDVPTPTLYAHGPRWKLFLPLKMKRENVSLPKVIMQSVEVLVEVRNELLPFLKLLCFP